MRALTVFALCLSVVGLAACGSPGYYDANGNYVAPAYAQRYHDASTVDYPVPAPKVIYVRPGYYDSYGNYVIINQNRGVPQSMLPPSGLCRVWFPERDIDSQPGIESCDSIRAPAGAYVIYGG